MTGKNPIGWFEISVSDFETAKTFYSSLFNWEFKLSQASQTIYWNIYTGENSIGGGFNKKAKSEDSGQSVILYIETDDIDETINKAVSLGGKAEKHKTLISETAGYYGLFKDSDGNVIGLWAKK